MAIAEVDRAHHAPAIPHGHDASARQLRDDVTSGLQEPLAEVLRTLQRLAIAQVSPDSPQLDPQLLVRARSLAHGLSHVIDELVTSGTQDGVLDGREPQETVLVRNAIEQAAVAAAASLDGRYVVVRGAERIAVTTNTARFHNLLVRILESASGHGEFRIVLDRSRGELLIQFEKAELSSSDLDAVRTMARSLGGTADRAATPQSINLVVWLPQQRVSDR